MKQKFLIVISIGILGSWYLYQNFYVNHFISSEVFTVSEILQKRVDQKHQKIKSGFQKFDNPSAYYSYHQGIRTRAGESGYDYPLDYRTFELNKARMNAPKNRRVSDLTFLARGPINTPGRSRSIVVFPDDPSNETWILGSVGGGIWKTTDAGETWENKTADKPSLAITSIAYCQSSPDIMYAGTGETIGGSVGIVGNGIYKSTDAGNSWEQLTSTANNEDFSFVNRVAIHPNDPDIVFMCSSPGPWYTEGVSNIYKSIDGGSSWQKVYESANSISQILFNPQNPNTLFATHWERGVLKSTDLGETWIEKETGFSKVNGRIELGMAPTDTSWIYASTVGDAFGVNFDLYLSTDAGESWNLVDQKYKSVRIDLLGGQGNYDNSIAVNPYNKKVVYYGGVNLWKSTVQDGETNDIGKDVSVETFLGGTSIWQFVNFGGGYDGGIIDLNDNLAIDDISSAIIVTGPGISQKAYRFTVDMQGSGVPDDGYIYQDYIDIPLQVWDTKNNRQLMVSFRDQQEDGGFNLIVENTDSQDAGLQSREYLFIHNEEYSETPLDEIAQDGGNNMGQDYQQMYFVWPVLQEGQTFDPDNLAEDTVFINLQLDTLTLIPAELENVSDAYNNFDEKNPAYDIDNGQFVLHPDHHFLELIPINNDSMSFQIYDCNDGGIYLSNIAGDPGINDGDWTFKGLGLNTGQFYGADKKPAEDIYIGGMQDNGTWLSPDPFSSDDTLTYSLVLTGDGFEALWNNQKPDEVLGSSQFNNFGKSTDGGETWFNVSGGIEGNSPFISKLANSPFKPQTVFTVTSLGVYKSDNFGTSWELKPITNDWGFSSFLNVEVSLSDYDIVWGGSGMSNFQKLHVSTDGGDTFASANNYEEVTLGNLSGLATHPFEDSTAYVLFSFHGGPKILRTNDLGQSWEDISGFGTGNVSANGFPDVAVYDLLVRPDNPEIIWAGTEIGIFESIDNGETWEFLENELGGVAIWQMKSVDDQIVIATHGRGIWSAQFDNPVEITFPPIITEGGTTIESDLYLKLDLYSAYDSSFFYANGNLIDGFAATEKIVDTVVIIPEPSIEPDQFYKIKMESYKGGRLYESDPVEILYYQVGGVVSEYTNDFNDLNDEDFIGVGFSLDQPDGFSNGSIHSGHPYPEAVELNLSEYSYYYHFKKPVKLYDGESIISFRDIAIVEIGEPGATFGEEDFYDYVVWEGSLNGYEWVSLADGYDANKFPSWLTALDNIGEGDSTLFQNQVIDMHQTFKEEDTLLIRMRLFSDPLSNGWGWAIDDLSIRSEVVTSLDDEVSDLAVTVYPNPARNDFNIEIESKRRDGLDIQLLDVNGKMVRDFNFNSLNAGKNVFNIQSEDLRRGVYLISIQTHSSGSKLKKIMLK